MRGKTQYQSQVLSGNDIIHFCPCCIVATLVTIISGFPVFLCQPCYEISFKFPCRLHSSLSNAVITFISALKKNLNHLLMQLWSLYFTENI